MNILFILGSRGEWGYIKPIIDLARKRGHNCEVLACNMAVIDRFGNLSDELIKEGYPIVAKFQTAIDGDNRSSLSKSFGVTALTAADWFSNNKYDWVVAAGDRLEQFAIVVVAATNYLPIAHIQAGERSGNIDGVTRHAIARFSHIHFAANQDAYDRLLKSGEQEYRIHLTGAPQLDEIDFTKLPTMQELKNRRIVENSQFALCVYHGTTEDAETNVDNLKTIISAINKFQLNKIWIGSNNDAQKNIFDEIILKSLRPGDKFFANMNRLDYLSLLANSQFIIGNSSSGILESASFKTPAINVGTRQKNRLKPPNVVDSVFDEKSIIDSIRIIQSEKFMNLLKTVENPYGNGDASMKIIEILENTEISPDFLIKEISF